MNIIKGVLVSATIGALVLGAAVDALYSQEKLTATAVNPLTNASSLYRIQFKSPVPLEVGAGFVLTFSGGFDLSRVNIAASSTILGGFTVRQNGQKLLVLRKARGPRLPAGKSVDLWISAVKNASSIGASRITLETYSDKKNAIARFESKENKTSSAVPPLVGEVVLRAEPLR